MPYKLLCEMDLQWSVPEGISQFTCQFTCPRKQGREGKSTFHLRADACTTPTLILVTWCKKSE